MNIPLSCIQRHWESDRGFDQSDYIELNLSEADAVREYSGPSDLDLAWSSSCSKLAQYLTKKGASIDSSIKWGHSPADDQNVEHVRNKRHLNGDESERPKRRRASVCDLVSDIQAVREMLQASIYSDPQKQKEDVF